MLSSRLVAMMNNGCYEACRWCIRLNEMLGGVHTRYVEAVDIHKHWLYAIHNFTCGLLFFYRGIGNFWSVGKQNAKDGVSDIVGSG
jgi:hypothetical protein